MEDPELAAIRAARMSQLKQNAAQGGGSEGGEEESKRAAEEQMRRDLLATVLDHAARERLARIALVSPQRSQQIEAILLRMAQTGQLRGRVTEEQLIELLEQADDAQSKSAPKKGTIVVRTRNPFLCSTVNYLIPSSSNEGKGASMMILTSSFRRTSHSRIILFAMSSRVHPHSPLPAPALHAANPSTQSKSHVLAGVQDAYWSDDEADDAECPLCLEEMDISDLNFKPCPCGYQICRFCWHHIKENLNGRCPACRRVYTDEAVQFKPINKEDHKRLTQQKKQRERERKELDALGRRHLANVRVVQRNVVYVVGMGPRYAKEELIPTLRSSEYFGQYGKISKIVIVKRTSPGGRAPVVGLYITYHRREDAARAIAAVDGAPSPGGGNEIMRASYGTTKYCMAFLRGASCPDHGCMNLHEWGDEKDCFTKEDLTTLKHTMKDTENRLRTTTVMRKVDEADAGLPRGASWGNKSSTHIASNALHNHTNMSQSVTRQTRRGATSTRQQRSGSTTTGAMESRTLGRDRKAAATAGKAPSVSSSSRPATPAINRPATPSAARATKPKESVQQQQPTRSPTVSTAVVSDRVSTGRDVPASPMPARQPVAKLPSVSLGIPVVPPGLPPPPGLPAPSRTTSAVSSPALISMQPVPSSSYQMSTQAQALMEDIKARREMPASSTERSPFPDFDRMLQTLSGDDGSYGGFSFNLDPALAGENVDATLPLPELEAGPHTPFNGTFLDPFPALRHGAPASPLMPPPGLSHPPRSTFDLTLRQPLERQSTGSSGYTGSFNPFAAEAIEEAPSRRYSPLEEERQVSRFGFARGRQGSSSSSLHPASPLTNVDNSSHMSFYPSSELASPARGTAPHWPFQSRHEYSQRTSAMSSPLAQHAQAAHVQQQPPPSGPFQPFETGVSEAQLWELISSSRERACQSQNGPSDQSQYNTTPNQPFNDPAIMSARMASPVSQQATPDGGFSYSPSIESIPSQQVAFGPPPGLSFGDGPAASIPGSIGHHAYGTASASASALEASKTSGSMNVSTSPSLEPSISASPALSSSDFPALSAAEPAARREQPQSGSSANAGLAGMDSAAQVKAERKAAKAAERQRMLQGKAEAKAAEKERIAAQKAAEKEKAAAQKAEKERLVQERAEIEKVEKEKAAQEKAEMERAEKEKAEKEKERFEKERAEKERAVQAKKTATLKASNDNDEKSLKQGQSSERTPRRPSKRASSPILISEPVTHEPILARMTKKNKPVAKPLRIPKEHSSADTASALPSAATSEAAPSLEMRGIESSSNNSRAHSVDRLIANQHTRLQKLLQDLDAEFPYLNASKHPFFDLQKINPTSKMPLEYGPLVHALSALSVGGGSFANNMPSGSIDHAVSSFQQLLETLTQTISDLLRLLPRKTWDDNSSFDGVLRDMLKGDDFSDDGGEDQNGHAKEDEVAALTLALERRARWMEVQLSKLEELHRDINTAAVRAVLSFNDNGWDMHGFLPRVGNSLARFDQLGKVNENGVWRMMTADELEKKLSVAKEAAVFSEAELRESMQRLQVLKPVPMDV
ncbi:uncharacterized protein LAESUDRAFT_642402 [Laetiporus sulphureus 93-53]|uniref:RING-type domain-containing protein n=1 Tax=Laetiporus sulphureus 93-53 TaxID=1314785 RepID=A0A165HE16_9APHY|nr:uncharacterized protein LAESUDRAFT_642402 [Laetiporus sulphureus 93-53]KZT11611.1 hypothetical protein LAESUDRAFT_642402 [Laetiporus sulphureus 93-53]